MQDYPSERVEVLAADAGSVDRSRAILASYEDRVQVRIVDNSARRGAEWGKAVALRHATGDLVQCMDADMWLTSRSMLRTLVAPFQQESDIAGVVAPFAFLPSCQSGHATSRSMRFNATPCSRSSRRTSRTSSSIRVMGTQSAISRSLESPLSGAPRCSAELGLT